MEGLTSLQTIEQQIKNLKSQGLKTKADKSKYDQAKSALNKLYAENKNYIMQFESTNYSHLALMRSTHSFYKMFGHSALFYACSIAPKLKLPANLQTDGDFTAKSEHGFVSIKDPEKLADTLRTIGIKKIKTKNQTGDFIIFKLPWSFTDQQITDFIENNHFKMRNFNHVVLVDNIIPVLFIQLEELTKAIYENIRGMTGPVEREAFGYDLIKLSISMLHLYLDLTNGVIDKYSCLKNLKLKLNSIKYQVKIIADLKIWQPKTCARVGDIIIKIQEIIINESKR